MKIRNFTIISAMLCMLLLSVGCQETIDNTSNSSEISSYTEQAPDNRTGSSDAKIRENILDDVSSGDIQLDEFSEKVISLDTMKIVAVNVPLIPLPDTLNGKDPIFIHDGAIYFATQIQNASGVSKSCELICVDIQTLEEYSRITVDTEYMPTFGNDRIFVLQNDRIINYGYDLKVVDEQPLPKALSSFAQPEGIKKHPAITRDGQKIIVLSQDWKPVILDVLDGEEQILDALTLPDGFSPNFYHAIIESRVPNNYVLISEGKKPYSTYDFLYSDHVKQIISSYIDEFGYNHWLDATTGIVYADPDAQEDSGWSSSVSINGLWANYEHSMLADFSKERIYKLGGENAVSLNGYATNGLIIGSTLQNYDSGQCYFASFPVGE